MITNTKGILQNGEKKESKSSQTQGAYYKTQQTQRAYYKTAKRKNANDHKHNGHITKRREDKKQMITNTKGILQNGEKKESK